MYLCSEEQCNIFLQHCKYTLRSNVTLLCCYLLNKMCETSLYLELFLYKNPLHKLIYKSKPNFGTSKIVPNYSAVRSILKGDAWFLCLCQVNTWPGQIKIGYWYTGKTMYLLPFINQQQSFKVKNMICHHFDTSGLHILKVIHLAQCNSL